MRSWTKIWFILGILLLMFPPLLPAQASYPEKLNEIVKQYPGSSVMASATNKQETNAMLTLAGTPIGDVLKFYKVALSKAGWEIENEMEVASTKSIQFKKAEKEFIIAVMDMGGQLMITLALTQ